MVRVEELAEGCSAEEALDGLGFGFLGFDFGVESSGFLRSTLDLRAGGTGDVDSLSCFGAVVAMLCVGVSWTFAEARVTRFVGCESESAAGALRRFGAMVRAGNSKWTCCDDGVRGGAVQVW